MNDIENYEELVKAVRLLSDRTDGRQPGSWFELQAHTIFTKIGLMADSSLHFIPKAKGFNGKFWDISTLAMLSRSVFESYLLLYYFAVESVTENERELRKLAWQLHGKREKLIMLESVNLESVGIPPTKREREEIEQEFRQKCSDPKKIKQALTNKDGLLKGRKETAQNAGIDGSFYLGTYKMLSSFTHPTPFGLNFLYNNSVESQGALEQVDILVQVTMGFLALTIRDFVRVFPDQQKFISPQIIGLIEHWEYIFLNWAQETCYSNLKCS